MMAAIKAIVFDLLTALLDSWTIWDLSIEASEKHIASGTTWRKRYLELTYGCGSYIDYETLVHRAAQDVGLSESTARNLSLNWDKIQPWPEVPAVLAQLRQQRVKLGVVTNCSNELGFQAVRNTEAVVRTATGVDFTFDEVVTAQESGFYKPDPKPYQDVLQKLGINAEETLFVAGSSADIPGAHGVGMRVVWNNHIGLERKTDLQPWREGKSLDEAMGDVLRNSPA
jgi:2-haloacid dehalogenase